MTENEKQFIIELEQLSRKYRLQIMGCGCCGSPSIEDIPDVSLDNVCGYAYEDHLQWIGKEWTYKMETYGDKIVGRGKNDEGN